MRALSFILAIIFALGVCARADTVAPVPEAEQAALASRMIDEFEGQRPDKPPKLLHIVYFTPADRDPIPRYQERLTAIFEDIRAFYRDEMQRQGFGPKTFDLERDTNGAPVIHVVKGTKPKADYESAWNKHYRIIGSECRPVLKAARISPEHETIVIVCNLADWDEKKHTFHHPSPYSGIWTQTNGLCWLMDSLILDPANLTNKQPVVKDFQFGKVPMNKRNSMFVGGFAHEMGHAFSLPHCGERWDEASRGRSLMGDGNWYYHFARQGSGPGAFLTMASAMKLAARPLFSGTDKDNDVAPHLDQCEMLLSTNLTAAALAGRRGALHMEGTVKGSPAVYGIIAYFDSIHDGGYHAPSATSVPDAQGRFALEVSDLKATTNGDLRVEFCHVNGSVSQRKFHFAVSKNGVTDTAQ